MVFDPLIYLSLRFFANLAFQLQLRLSGNFASLILDIIICNYIHSIEKKSLQIYLTSYIDILQNIIDNLLL